MSNKRIIYTSSDGALCVVIPADANLTLDQVAKISVPANTQYEVIDVDALPNDRYFRTAWKAEGKRVAVDMPAAREIVRDTLRKERAPLLARLDTDYMQALEQGKDTTKIVALKQQLRDVTADPAIEKAKTPEELKAVEPECIKIAKRIDRSKMTKG